MKPQTTFASVLTRFFTQRLMEQRHASPHTIHSYRDTFRLLLAFACRGLKKEPATLSVRLVPFSVAVNSVGLTMACGWRADSGPPG